MKRLAFAALLLTAVPMATAAAQAPTTVQQEFDAASAVFDAGNWAEAARLYEALEARVRSARNRAITRVRRGASLAELGRRDEAVAILEDALPSLPAGDPSLDGDRFAGHVALGLIAESRLDYDAALQHFRLAAALPVPRARKAVALRGLIQTQLFSDAAGALRDADLALRTVAEMQLHDETLAAQFHTLKGRALLNLARHAEAQAELELALEQLGNLTLRADINDLIARSDLATAAMLAGNEMRARQYLAYSGASRAQQDALRLWRHIEIPRCGGALSPADLAVLQLSLADDGRVALVVPIYSSRQGPAALALARAATRWTFAPKGTGEVPALLRAAARVEIHCSNLSGPEDETSDNFLARVAAADPTWARGLAENLNRPTAEIQRALVRVAPASGSDPLEALPLLMILSDRREVGATQRLAMARRILAIAAAHRAPAPIVARIALSIDRANSRNGRIRPRTAPPDFPAILALPEVGASLEVTAEIRMAEARYHYSAGAYDRALAAADMVIRAAPAAGTRLVMEARQTQVAAHAAMGNMEAARTAHAAIGPAAQRCGIPPRAIGATWDWEDYPRLALQWGFEGWAISEVTIAPDGSVIEGRTVMAYPPLVFGEAALEITRRPRRVPTFVPDGAPCTYERQRVTFLLPR